MELEGIAYHFSHEADKHTLVLTDAATSVLAIVALLGGWLGGWAWLDPLMGIVGAAVVALWARGLLVQSSAVLLDREMDHPVVAEIHAAFQTPEDRAHATDLSDLHVWRVGPGAYACALSVITHDAALDAAAIRARLAVHTEIAHTTIEVQHCANPVACTPRGHAAPSSATRAPGAPP